MISTHFKKPGSPGELTLKRMEVAARKAESFIEHMKDFETIQQQNLELEDKVNDRTRALIGSLEREKQMNDLKSRFVSMASHEFRTPLSVILSSMSLIEHYVGEGDERVNKHLSKVKTAASNLTTILNDFLSLDKLEQGKVVVDWEEFDTAEFLDTIIEETMSLRKQGQQVSTSHRGGPRITSDNKKLRYIILNLLSNAMKYSPENTDIVLTSHQEDNNVTISIQDHGIGIPEEEQKFLFNKFFRAKNAGTIQGTGLGLTIVKLYVDLMGGSIAFSSRQNEGTTFTIRLPQTQ
jgi:signal transduction histidine kinase